MASGGGSNSKVKLAILDDYASIATAHFSSRLSSRVEIESFPTTVNARTESGRGVLLDRLAGCAVVSTMRERTAFPREVVSGLPDLKLLLTTGMGNAAIDLAACEEHGVTVSGTQAPSFAKGYESTNEQNWALILGLAKNIARDDHVVKSDPKGWSTDLAFGLAGKTLGLLGLGKLGTMCAVTGMLGFGMKVVAWSENLTQAKADAAAEARGLAPGSFTVVDSKADLFRQADVLSVHYVLSPRSRGLVTETELSLMKPDALLVNTSRGPLVDEQALLKTLEAGKIRGAALDVFDLEPLPEDSPWRSTKWGTGGRSQVVLSPHMGYVEERVMHAWYEQQAVDLERFLDSQPVLHEIKAKR